MWKCPRCKMLPKELERNRPKGEEPEVPDGVPRETEELS
jgi:hypothetical protein